MIDRTMLRCPPLPAIKEGTPPDDFFTPPASPLIPEPPRPLPLSDYTPPRRNLAGARRCSSSTPPTIPSTPGAAATLFRLVVLDNVDCPPLRPRWTLVSPSPRPLCRRLGLELVGARLRRGRTAAVRSPLIPRPISLHTDSRLSGIDSWDPPRQTARCV
jgi:hypothetical protein